MRLPRRSAVVVLLASMLVGAGALPASAHCSLGPFDAAIAYSDSVWAGEIVAGKKIDDPRTPYELTLRVDDVLSGEDPGPEATILAQPCKKRNGVAPSTIDDYVGLTGVFAIANVPTGYFYVETFAPEGDPVAAALAVLALDAPSASPPASAVAPTPSGSTDGGSTAILAAVGVLAVAGVGLGVLVRSRSRQRVARARKKSKGARAGGTTKVAKSRR